MKIKKINYSMIFYILLFLSCLNFKMMGSFIFLILGIYALFTEKGRFFSDKFNMILVIVLFINSFIVSVMFFGMTDAIKCFNFLSSYIIGYSLFKKSIDKEKFIRNSITSIFLGFALQIILIYFYNLYVGQPSSRTLHAVWNDGLISVTVVGLLSSVIIGYSFYAFFICKKNILKLVAIFSSIIMVCINMMTATRTPFVIFLIVFLFLLFVFFKNNGSKAKSKLCIALTLIGCLFFSLYMSDWNNIRTNIQTSPIAERMDEEGFKTGRTEIVKLYLSKMDEYPFGGGFVKEDTGLYAHNILQEIYDLYGIIPFLVVTILYFQALYNIFFLMKNNNFYKINYLIIGMYLAIMIQMFVEPVIEGFPILFYVFIFIHGLSCSHVHYIKRMHLERKIYYENSLN